MANYITNITKVGSDWDVTSLENSYTDLEGFQNEGILTFNWPGSLKQWFLSYNSQYATALADVCESWPELRGNFNNISGFAGYELVYIPYVKSIAMEEAEGQYKEFPFYLFAVVNNNQYIQHLGKCTVLVNLGTNKPVRIDVSINNTPDDSFDPNHVETR